MAGAPVCGKPPCTPMALHRTSDADGWHTRTRAQRVPSAPPTQNSLQRPHAGRRCFSFPMPPPPSLAHLSSSACVTAAHRAWTRDRVMGRPPDETAGSKGGVASRSALSAPAPLSPAPPRRGGGGVLSESPPPPPVVAVATVVVAPDRRERGGIGMCALVWKGRGRAEPLGATAKAARLRPLSRSEESRASSERVERGSPPHSRSFRFHHTTHTAHAQPCSPCPAACRPRPCRRPPRR